MVGMTGFEPAAPSSRTKCATKLRYIPIYYSIVLRYHSLVALWQKNPFCLGATSSQENLTFSQLFSRQSATSRYTSQQFF